MTLVGEVLLAFTEVADECFWHSCTLFLICKTQEIPGSELIILKRDQSLCGSDTALKLFLEVVFVS